MEVFLAVVLILLVGTGLSAALVRMLSPKKTFPAAHPPAKPWQKTATLPMNPPKKTTAAIPTPAAGPPIVVGKAKVRVIKVISQSTVPPTPMQSAGGGQARPPRVVDVSQGSAFCTLCGSIQRVPGCPGKH